MKLKVVYPDGTESYNVWPDDFNGEPLAMRFERVDILPYKPGLDIHTLIDQFSEPDCVLVLVIPEFEGYFGYAYDATTVLLAQNRINMVGWFKHIFARWVLRHEFGHLRGLEHHVDPLCIMSKPNASFGRFCGGCSIQLKESKWP